MHQERAVHRDVPVINLFYAAFPVRTKLFWCQKNLKSRGTDQLGTPRRKTPKPKTLNSNPQLLNPEPWTLNPEPRTLKPEPWTLNSKFTPRSATAAQSLRVRNLALFIGIFLRNVFDPNDSTADAPRYLRGEGFHIETRIIYQLSSREIHHTERCLLVISK